MYIYVIKKKIFLRLPNLQTNLVGTDIPKINAP